MPKCQNCGNEELFVATFRGSETRVFDPETGDEVDSKHLKVEQTLELACENCTSTNITMGDNESNTAASNDVDQVGRDYSPSSSGTDEATTISLEIRTQTQYELLTDALQEFQEEIELQGLDPERADEYITLLEGLLGQVESQEPDWA